MTVETTLMSIAGSDPSGGAGIQADLKTMTSIGVYGATALTALTVQNSKGVSEIFPLDPGFVQQQIEAILEDHLVTHIKVGMLGSPEVIEVVANLLAGFKGVVVYDPVLHATSGGALVEGEAVDTITIWLLPHISYLTPNRDELTRFAGKPIRSISEGIASAREILSSYPQMRGVVVKGGHFDQSSQTITDFLVLQDNTEIESKRKRIDTPNLHGTGCTFATAFCSFLLLGDGPGSAFLKAGDYMDRIVSKTRGTEIARSGTNGPLIHYRVNKNNS